MLFPVKKDWILSVHIDAYRLDLQMKVDDDGGNAEQILLIDELSTIIRWQGDCKNMYFDHVIMDRDEFTMFRRFYEAGGEMMQAVWNKDRES